MLTRGGFQGSFNIIPLAFPLSPFAPPPLHLQAELDQIRLLMRPNRAVRSGIGDTEEGKSLGDLFIVEEDLLGLVNFAFDDLGDAA